MKKLSALILAGFLLIMNGCGSKENTHGLDKDDPVTISVWHYYNGPQNMMFDNLVKEFNESEGREKGIVVEAFSLGNISEVNQQVLNAADKKVGAKDMPNIFTAYRDLAYDVNKRKKAANIKDYMSEDEIDQYADDFIKEGEFDDKLLIFPTAKCSELMVLNKTDWDVFAQASGADIDELSTMEGLNKVAQEYYEYSDQQTPQMNDGKAFFGRDAFANYMYLGVEELGSRMFAVKDGKANVTLDKNVIRTLWDNYYVPYIKGYIHNEGKFSSDDAKTGDILAYAGSTSASSYVPKEVVDDDEHSHAIETIFLNVPHFKDGKQVSIQQGAGMSIAKSNEKEEYASVVFLKWFTQPKRNIEFSIQSGYLPVTKKAMDIDYYKKQVKAMKQVNEQVLECNLQTLKQFEDGKIYVSETFDGAQKVRDVLETSMRDQAKRDRKAVSESLANGMSFDEAVSAYVSDEAFQTWYTAFEKQLKEAVQ